MAVCCIVTEHLTSVAGGRSGLENMRRGVRETEGRAQEGTKTIKNTWTESEIDRDPQL